METHTLGRSQPESRAAGFAPSLLIETQPGYRVFFLNLADTLFPHRTVRHEHGPDWPDIWPDIFVPRPWPWWGLAQSLTVHLLCVAALWGASRMWRLRPQIYQQSVFSKNDVIYLPASAYLPPLDTGKPSVSKQQKGEPEYRRQTILSVPAEADNRVQTVVTPPNVRLKNELSLPNVVAWRTVHPSAPIDAAMHRSLPVQSMDVIAPAPSLELATERRRLQPGQDAVVAPPPSGIGKISQRATGVPGTAIIEPPPVVQDQVHHFGDIQIEQADIVAPAPQLILREQRAISYTAAAWSTEAAGVVPPPPAVTKGGVAGLRRGAAANTPVNIVAPPPSLQGAASSPNRIVALGLHPVPAPAVAGGNRRGTFAMSPNGKPGAAGAPDTKSGTHDGSSAAFKGPLSDLPAGLLVQPGPSSSPRAGTQNSELPSDSMVIADVKTPPPVTVPPRRALASTSAATAEEREVFGDRKFYSMTLNMPNLNSAGGSWVIRFAELKEKDTAETGDLTAPEALRKVDPAYPLELMRSQIQGRVTLYAVIHSDGHVGDVRVLSSVDGRLDEYARAALSRWRFRPATKAGAAVALEAVVTIPFRARPAF